MLTAIRRNDVEEGLLYSLEERRIYDHAEAGMATKLYTHNTDVDRINQDELNKLDGEMTRHEMIGSGRANIVEKLKMSCISPEILHLKEGAVVMFTKNNFEKGYANGTLGSVIGFTEDEKNPIVETKQGETITVEQAEWIVEENGKQLGKITQYPLRLAWAITVHKSQGMSLDAAVIDLSQAFEYGQGYVALSRVRSRAGLFLLGLNARALEVHPLILETDQSFRDHSKKTEQLFRAMKQEELKVMHENFILSIGGKVPKNKVLKEKNKNTGSGVKKTLVEMREKHANAYKKWDEVQEKELQELFQQKKKYSEIAKIMGRKIGGVTARLKKLGLIDE
jgi:hypothetical protein